MTRPAVWSCDGVQPLTGVSVYDRLDSVLAVDEFADPDDAMRPTIQQTSRLLNIGDGPRLVAEAVRHACSRPLATDMVHTVATRSELLRGRNDLEEMLSLIGDDRSWAEQERMSALGRWLCRFGVTRSHVAAGLVLVGSSGREADIALISRLGRISMLTTPAAMAISGLLSQPEKALFELAKATDGWGRVHAIHGLPARLSPKVQEWLLRGGYAGGVAVEEVAYSVVTKGDLVSALRCSADEDILHHAGILIGALLDHGPSGDIRDYPEGGLALELYLRSVSDATASCDRLRTVAAIADFLERPALWHRHLLVTQLADLNSLCEKILSEARLRPDQYRAFSGSISVTHASTPPPRSEMFDQPFCAM
jgi:hypothetical protein